MRNVSRLIAMGAVIAAAPALAQVNVGVGGQVGGNVGVGVNPGGAIGGVTGTLDRTVGTVDRTVNQTLDRDLRIATSADVTAGATIRDRRGNQVGTVQSVHGGTAVVVNGNRTMHVPISRLYRGASGLVTKLSKAELKAMASTSANGSAHISN